jgi:hypothetical protein
MSQRIAEDTFCPEVNDIKVIFIMLIQNVKEILGKEVIGIGKHQPVSLDMP